MKKEREATFKGKGGERDHIYSKKEFISKKNKSKKRGAALLQGVDFVEKKEGFPP